MQPAPRPRNPVVPADATDRTGSAGIRRRANAAIRRRFDALRGDLLAIFGGIRVYRANDARGAQADTAAADEPAADDPLPDTSAQRTAYGLTPAELALLSAALGLAVSRWLDAAPGAPSAGWWDAFIAEAAQLGAAQSVANLARLSPAYAATRTLQQATTGDAYRERLAAMQFAGAAAWAEMAASLRADVAQIIGRAVVDGEPPRAVRAAISARVEAAKTNALAFAVASITGAVRAARIAEADYAEQELGIRLGLLWTSALLPTTRSWHASRHGHSYTAAEVRAFYAQRGNRYNCRCSTTEVLLDEERRPIVSDALARAMARERATWGRRNGG